MNPDTGDVFELRRELVDTAIGERLEMEQLRERIAALGADATADEAMAIRQQQLVAVSEQAAVKLKLGERERERRRRRRKATKNARRTNR